MSDLYGDIYSHTPVQYLDVANRRFPVVWRYDRHLGCLVDRQDPRHVDIYWSMDMLSIASEEEDVGSIEVHRAQESSDSWKKMLDDGNESAMAKFGKVRGIMDSTYLGGWKNFGFRYVFENALPLSSLRFAMEMRSYESAEHVLRLVSRAVFEGHNERLDPERLKVILGNEDVRACACNILGDGGAALQLVVGEWAHMHRCDMVDAVSESLGGYRIRIVPHLRRCSKWDDHCRNLLIPPMTGMVAWDIIRTYCDNSYGADFRLMRKALDVIRMGSDRKNLHIQELFKLYDMFELSYGPDGNDLMANCEDLIPDDIGANILNVNTRHGRILDVWRLGRLMRYLGIRKPLHEFVRNFGIEEMRNLTINSSDLASSIVEVDERSFELHFKKMPHIIRTVPRRFLPTCNVPLATLLVTERHRLGIDGKELMKIVTWLTDERMAELHRIPNLMSKLHRNVRRRKVYADLRYMYQKMYAYMSLPLLLGQRMPGCVLSMLDSSLIRRIIEMAFA
jgi:hypothetical protein